MRPPCSFSILNPQMRGRIPFAADSYFLDQEVNYTLANGITEDLDKGAMAAVSVPDVLF